MKKVVIAAILLASTAYAGEKSITVKDVIMGQVTIASKQEGKVISYGLGCPYGYVTSDDKLMQKDGTAYNKWTDVERLPEDVRAAVDTIGSYIKEEILKAEGMAITVEPLKE